MIPSILPPAYIDRRAVEIYEATFPELLKPVTFTNSLLLGAYSQAMSDWERLTTTILEDGDADADHNGEKRKHPLGIPQAKSFDMMTKAAVLLGIGKKDARPVANEKPKSKIASMRKAPRQKKIG
jgi:phage terminase small subunit